MRESARSKIRVIVKRVLGHYGYPPDLQDEAVQSVLLQAETLCKDWKRPPLATKFPEEPMMKSGDCELLDTASAILHALSQDTAQKAVRLLITHNLVSGTSTRHHVDEFGNKQELQGEWNNGRAVRGSLERKPEKGNGRLADEDA